jgi:hypothetical protein
VLLLTVRKIPSPEHKNFILMSIQKCPYSGIQGKPGTGEIVNTFSVKRTPR